MCAQKGGVHVSPITGRPHAENPKSERLYIRITPDEKEKIMQFCKEFEVSILDLIRLGMDALKK